MTAESWKSNIVQFSISLQDGQSAQFMLSHTLLFFRLVVLYSSSCMPECPQNEDSSTRRCFLNAVNKTDIRNSRALFLIEEI